MVPPEETAATLALNELSGFGPAALRSLIERFGGAAAAVSAGPRAWSGELTAEFVESLERELVSAAARARADMESAERYGARIYLSHRGPYPELLSTLATPPSVLYVKGADVAALTRAVAIVGSRACTHYGEKIARRISSDLAAAGVATVSGLARGIDTNVHQATLAAGGVTIAVVGSGLLMTYPPENRALADRICAEGGAVVSEFAMAVKPHPANFPRRNRIIAGLSSATVVVEGGSTSGALITARIAAEEGREVFAVPGPAGSAQSRAPHRLLRDGATMAESAEDVLSELGWTGGIILNDPPAPALSGAASAIFAAVSDVPIDRDELIERVNLDAASAATWLVQLEMKGLIRSVAGGKLVRA